MPEMAIVDASALIALEKINLLDILCRLYAEIILPEAVMSLGLQPLTVIRPRELKVHW